MFVAFSALLLRVLCVYTLIFATSVPACFRLTKSPLSAKKSILSDKMTMFCRISTDLLVYVMECTFDNLPQRGPLRSYSRTFVRITSVWRQKNQINLIIGLQNLQIPIFCCTFARKRANEGKYDNTGIYYPIGAE